MSAEQYMIPCLNKTLFGVECFGCGTQRSLYLLFQGKFVEAFYMYPPIYTLLLFFMAIGFHFFDKSRNYNKIIIVLAIINAIIMVTSYIYKQTNF
ncbi:DUF2752 domain-containing protein [Flavobacterium sp. GCM10027622]|uniref:DUF2752 domain-containing protein n=2 Tax=unclassified Flavobacterium TaxID=196869 RepID=UPI0036209EBC